MQKKFVYSDLGISTVKHGIFIDKIYQYICFIYEMQMIINDHAFFFSESW